MIKIQYIVTEKANLTDQIKKKIQVTDQKIPMNLVEKKAILNA
jgi:hypothetical protein